MLAIELRQLRYFEAIARHGSFRRAASELNLAQPALSQQIKRLERELGNELFDRSGRFVRLTPVGESMLPHARQILGEVESARLEVDEFSGLARGQVTIGTEPAVDDLDLAGTIVAFHSRYPGIDLRLREENRLQILELLTKGDLDLVITVFMAESEGPAGVVYEKLSTQELVAVVARGHPLAHRTKLVLSDLRNEQVIARPGSALLEAILVSSPLHGRAHLAYETSDRGMLDALVTSGLGVAVVPKRAALAASESVTTIELGPPSLTRTIALAWMDRRYQSAAARAFLAFARDYFG
jgi:DNA-binding transcriptional LysR family regulator